MIISKYSVQPVPDNERGKLYLMPELQSAVVQYLACVHRAASFEIIVEDWRGADATREANGKFPRRVHCAKDDLGDGLSAQFAGVELLNDGVGICNAAGNYQYDLSNAEASNSERKTYLKQSKALRQAFH